MKTKDNDYWVEIEEGLGSRGRIRILHYLLEHSKQQFSKYVLRNNTGLTSKETSRQIQTLVKLGWVKEFSIRPKTYSANIENPIVKLISDFFYNLNFYELNRFGIP
jgi:DNA-binding transcriptional ArsR family regulator